MNKRLTFRLTITVILSLLVLAGTCSATVIVEADAPRNLPLTCKTVRTLSPAATIVRDLSEIGWCTVTGELPFMVAALSETDHVWGIPEPVEGGGAVSVADAEPEQTDPLWPQQWGPRAIRADAAWRTTAGRDTHIAILDTGVDSSHPDLRGRVAVCYDAITSSNSDCVDAHGHGTHVAGIAAAPANGVGIVGVAPRALLFSVKVLNDDGQGSVSSIAHGIIEATQLGADVINMSLGGSAGSSVVNDALEYADQNGVTMVAAAGNGGGTTFGDSCLFPGRHPLVICVGAINHNDEPPAWQNDWPDVEAPGVNVLSTVPGGTYEKSSGTSMASPHAAGVTALWLSLHPGSPPSDVRERILGTVRRIPGCHASWCGAGVIDAVNMLEQEELLPTPTRPWDTSPYPGPTETQEVGPTASPFPSATDTLLPTLTPTASAQTPTPRLCGDLGHINVWGTRGVDLGLAFTFMTRSPSLCGVTDYPDPETGRSILLGRCPVELCDAYSLIFEDWGYETVTGANANWHRAGWPGERK